MNNKTGKNIAVLSVILIAGLYTYKGLNGLVDNYSYVKEE